MTTTTLEPTPGHLYTVKAQDEQHEFVVELHLKENVLEFFSGFSSLKQVLMFLGWVELDRNERLPAERQLAKAAKCLTGDKVVLLAVSSFHATDFLHGTSDIACCWSPIIFVPLDSSQPGL